MQARTITLLGATGFVGVQLATKLNSRGYRVNALTRHNARHNELLVLSHVKQIQADTHNEDVLADAFAGSDAVINLVGILNQAGQATHTFQNAHVELVRKVVNACNRSGVRHYLHMSALNAAPDGSSEYLQTKGQGEKLAFELAGEALQVTAFRPSVIFGPEDSFFNRFAGLLQLLPVMPLACPDARMAPVYIGDVCDRFLDALENPDSTPERMDLVGPKTYTLEELVRFTARTIGKNTHILRLPDWAARLQARIMEFVPGKPFTMDNYLSLQTDSTSDQPGAMQKTSIEAIVPGYLGKRCRTNELQAYRTAARRD